MVNFHLIDKTNILVKYAYYPDGKKDKVGYLVFDVNTKNIKEIIPSEEDFLIVSTVDEQNRLRNSLNEMRKENGRELLSEEEWPIAIRDVEYYCYASKVIDKISRELNMLNNFPNEGNVVWY